MMNKILMIAAGALVSVGLGVFIGAKLFSTDSVKEIPVVITETKMMFIETEKKTSTVTAKKITKKISKPDGTKIETVTEENIKQNETTNNVTKATQDVSVVPVYNSRFSIGSGLLDVTDYASPNSIYVTGGVRVISNIWINATVAPLQKKVGLGVSIQF